MLTCDFIAKYLKKRGVKQVFGTPGSDTISLINAFSDQGINYILTHHENTAAYMASTYGEITGIPGIVIVTKGPGVTNLASGIASAYLDRRPIIIFSAIIDPDLLARNPHQDVELVSFGGLITKLSEELTSENAAELMDRAYRTSIEPRPGAVYLPISPIQAIKDIEINDEQIDSMISVTYTQNLPEKNDFDFAIKLINKSKRPIVVAGVGVVGSKVSNDLISFVQSIQSPCCVTLQAVGNYPCDDPLYIGMYGWFGTPIDEMLKKADTIITIGLDGWDIIRPFKSQVPIISIDSVDVNDRTFQPVTQGLRGDISGILDFLENNIGQRNTSTEWLSLAKQSFNKIQDYELGVSTDYNPSDGIAPQSVYKEIRKFVPKDTIITADAGAHKSLASQAWLSYLPLSYFVSNGLSPMGFSLGAAMGAKIASPESPVISFVGDGGFLMYAGELATWKRLNIPMIQIIMVDNALTQVKSKQLKRGYNTESTSFDKVEYKRIVESFGIEAIEVSKVTELVEGTKRALQLNKPVSIIVNLDGSEYLRMPSAV
ncbi:MAG: thiamine pyrophosphate-binding protein [Hyphomicrobiales bacterium]|jgi:acetolactate synthase I/II/III large subunit|nr:thiamine pyrophosphate-binding protein [Hyphomicrobiales bacterium]